MCAYSSQWDDLEPDATWRARLANPATAALQVAADRALIKAMSVYPIDVKALHKALLQEACASRPIHHDFPALHVALAARDDKALALLLRFGARVDDVDGNGATALDLAYQLNFKEGIAQLKQQDAPRSASDETGSAYRHRINRFLCEMIKQGTAQQVQQALDLGADVNATGPYGREAFPPLHLAAAYVAPDKVKILLQAGADVFAKGAKGSTAADALWFAKDKDLLSPAWYEIFEGLQAHGFQNLFTKHPADFTPDDLRQPLPIGVKEAPSLLHCLVQRGQVDFVLNIFEKHPEHPLTAAELQTPSAYFNNNTLLQALSGQKALARVFTAAVWQGRVDEMLSLKPVVEKDFLMKGKVDFTRAAADVRAAHLAKLGQQAGNRFKLKSRPHL